ncbi:DUF7574 domain-containing protein [Nocardia grenadensis]|uniref:DUF7574 domain-containing protein n=1 Tax=Nocardia grenadensis TaxID=931537 RepID=UPI003D723A67
MGWNSPDVYYDPDKFGLIKVGELTLEEPDYSFNIGLVLYHPDTQNFYYVEDSGCSCPSPFENFTSIESLGKPMKYEELWLKLRSVKGSTYSPPETPIAIQASRIIDRAYAVSLGAALEHDC